MRPKTIHEARATIQETLKKFKPDAFKIIEIGGGGRTKGGAQTSEIEVKLDWGVVSIRKKELDQLRRKHNRIEADYEPEFSTIGHTQEPMDCRLYLSFGWNLSRQKN